MKRVLLALFLCISLVASAQDWEKPYGIIVVNPNGQEISNVQKTECWNDEYIVGLGATHQDSCYFISWFKQGLTFNQSQVFNCGTIYDFAILDDRVYFCGQQKTPTDTNGFVGVFLLNNLVNGQPITYGVRKISETKTLTRLEVYKDKDTTHIVAIGELKTASNGTNKSCLVMLDDKNNPAFNYYIRTSQTSSNVLFERFSDIVVTDNYVATVSFVSFAEKFLIRRCDLHTPENPLLQKCFFI